MRIELDTYQGEHSDHLDYDEHTREISTCRWINDGNGAPFWTGHSINLTDLLQAIPRDHIVDALALIDEDVTEPPDVARLVTLEPQEEST